MSARSYAQNLRCGEDVSIAGLTRKDTAMRWASKIAKLHFAVLLVILAPLPASAYEPATIAHLEQILAAAHGKPDKALAKQLGELELTERLSTARLKKLEAALPGEKSRQVLLVLSDLSAFHDLPAEEILQVPAPDSDSQSKILGKVADYIREALPRQIDLVISRNTSQFDNLKVVTLSGSSEAAKEWAKTKTEVELEATVSVAPLIAAAVVENQPYHFIGKNSEAVNYRNGAEEVAGLPPAEHRKVPPQSGLTNWGVFGPLLEVVVNDVSGGKTEWSHWEQGTRSVLAVFHYDVPADQSNYDVEYCCFTSGKTWDFSGKELWNVYESLTPAYHGEIAVDPMTGAILRLTIETVIPEGQPIYGAKVMVEYGPVELGGREYLLPAKSVSISVAPVPVMIQDGHCTDGACTHGLFVHPKDTVVRDTIYTSYHAFRGDTRILPTDAFDKDADSPSSAESQPGIPRKQP
ncbi:hypothetical protein P8935_08085 [Telmatobacter sp. DSM 110680]|uniref:Uncharacterized protein n=1 Tax=Telmatobacter sp. DSM 110680 TaxID=3036704 RepID=A0AAU7DMZ3_9BACT